MIQEYMYVRMQTLEHLPSWVQPLVPVTTHHLTEIQLVEVLCTVYIYMCIAAHRYMYMYNVCALYMSTMSYMYVCV